MTEPTFTSKTAHSLFNTCLSRYNCYRGFCSRGFRLTPTLERILFRKRGMSGGGAGLVLLEEVLYKQLLFIESSMVLLSTAVLRMQLSGLINSLTRAAALVPFAATPAQANVSTQLILFGTVRKSD